jgi:tetratricopeptide (TPR) repeat protein
MHEECFLLSPQPVGIWPLPAGYLLVSEGPGHAEACDSLVGGHLPEAWPEGLRYYELALSGELPGALEAITGNDPVSLVNRLVLAPSAELLNEIRVVANGALACYAEVIAYAAGLTDTPPPPDAAEGEIAAMAYAAQATAAIARGERREAVEALDAAAQAAKPVSSALTGQLLGQMANVQLDEGGAKRAAVTFQAALDLLEGTDLAVSRAELHVSCAAMHQEMSEAAPRLLRTAVDHYLAALRLVTIDTAPEVFAIANANLGLAYLSMPMSDASDLLRIGVAVQSMRDALKVFTPNSHRDRWSATQPNLANALVYMPSTHHAENIAEAVLLYEEVLANRDRCGDPGGRARVLANQGNALAHLGVFDKAKARLHEARAIFEELGQGDAVRSVRSVLDEIAKQESKSKSKSGDTRMAPSGMGADPGLVSSS